MEEKKNILFLNSGEGEELKNNLGRALEIYGKGDVMGFFLLNLNSVARQIEKIANVRAGLICKSTKITSRNA